MQSGIINESIINKTGFMLQHSFAVPRSPPNGLINSSGSFTAHLYVPIPNLNEIVCLELLSVVSRFLFRASELD